MEIKSSTVFIFVLQFRTHIFTYLKKKILEKKSARGFENLWVDRVWANKTFFLALPYMPTTNFISNVITIVCTMYDKYSNNKEWCEGWPGL